MIRPATPMRIPDSGWLRDVARWRSSTTPGETLLKHCRPKIETEPPCPALAKAVTYLSEHLAEKIHLRDLAGAAGVSVRTIGYLFLQTYGTTPMAFLKQQRLEQAGKLLMHADPLQTSVAEIARQCGFTHMGQFSLDYKRATGERPSESLRRGHQPPKSSGPVARRRHQ